MRKHCDYKTNDDSIDDDDDEGDCEHFYKKINNDDITSQSERQMESSFVIEFQLLSLTISAYIYLLDLYASQVR